MHLILSIWEVTKPLNKGVAQLDRGEEGVRMTVKEVVAQHKKGKHS